MKTVIAVISLSLLLFPALALAQIGWANLQWPPTYNGASCSGQGIYGQIWIDGVTSNPGPTPDLQAQLGFGPPGSVADGSWIWIDAGFNVDVGNNDEFVVFLDWVIPVGTYDYAYRYRQLGDLQWFYADLNGPAPGGNLTNPGQATITDACGAVPNEPVSWGALKTRF